MNTDLSMDNKSDKEDQGVKVSVIIPVYNTEQYIKRSVDSVLNQTFGELEVLLVDDGSTDRSWDICKEIAEKDSRVCLFRQEHSGVSAARNLGLKKCRGEYVFFLDSDDEYKQNLLQKAVHIFENCNCDCIRFQDEYTEKESVSRLFSDEEWKLYSQKEFIVKALSNFEIYCNLSSCCFGAYKREIIEKSDLCFKEEFALGEDGIFVMEYLLKSNKIVYMRDVLYTYYTFDPEKRVSTTSPQIKVLYDAYELYFIIHNMVYQKYRDVFNQEEKSVIYLKFYDQMIAFLVQFAAYSKHLNWKQIKVVLRELLSSDLMMEAGNYYAPSRKTDSKYIPYFMRKKWMWWLWGALRQRSGQYLKAHGKKEYIVSIYRNHEMVEYKDKNKGDRRRSNAKSGSN